MKLKQLIILAIVITGLPIVMSCTSENESSGESKISQAGGNESHNMGQNCMNCHKPGGSGDGQFKVAGTVYNSQRTATYPNAIVKFFTQPDGGGTLRATLSGDANGNFYTTEIVDFSAGLYPAIFGNSGKIKYMSAPVTTGACASCHGSSTEKLWVD